MILIPLVLALGIIISRPDPPNLNHPEDLAAWSQCKPGRVSYWVKNNIEYKLVPKWEDAGVCMRRGYGDCKCKAVVAGEALKSCGYDTRILIIQRDPKSLHAITVFTRGNQTGYIDDGDNFVFTGVEREEIINKMHRGPWKIYDQR